MPTQSCGVHASATPTYLLFFFHYPAVIISHHESIDEHMHICGASHNVQISYFQFHSNRKGQNNGKACISRKLRKLSACTYHLVQYSVSSKKNVLQKCSIKPQISDAQPKNEIGPSFFTEKRAKGAVTRAVTMTF